MARSAPVPGAVPHVRDSITGRIWYSQNLPDPLACCARDRRTPPDSLGQPRIRVRRLFSVTASLMLLPPEGGVPPRAGTPPSGGSSPDSCLTEALLFSAISGENPISA